MDKKVEIGQVIEALPNAQFKVQLESGREIIAYPSGRMKVNKINLVVGDKVKVEIDPYNGKTSNRVVYRL